MACTVRDSSSIHPFYSYLQCQFEQRRSPARKQRSREPRPPGHLRRSADLHRLISRSCVHRNRVRTRRPGSRRGDRYRADTSWFRCRSPRVGGAPGPAYVRPGPSGRAPPRICPPWLIPAPARHSLPGSPGSQRQCRRVCTRGSPRAEAGFRAVVDLSPGLSRTAACRVPAGNQLSPGRAAGLSRS